MSKVETILARFPGPVTLHTGRILRLLALIFFAGLGVFSVFFLVSGRAHGWYDTVMMGLAVIACFALAIQLVIMLFNPDAVSLTLRADGFERHGVFERRRWSWREVKGFRVQKSGSDRLPDWVTFDVIEGGAGPERIGGRRTHKALPYYGLSLEDLVWLLEQWRQRALAHHSPTHP
jgi:hypothetical protein